ncbi:MAG: ABC transporter permease subunit [Candidatus Zixiibacteriota bacterium]
MLSILINKELRAIVSSPKFVGAFVVCSILILLSIYTGIREYRVMSARYDAAALMVDQEIRQETSWGRMSTEVFRRPDPMQIFAAGLDYDIGRWSPVSNRGSAKLKNSAYSDDPIYSVFRFLDFSFITQFILTLFAILFTYNAVNGEREDGTLKLIMSNAVSRAKFLIGKCVGAWLGLVVPVTIPILLGFLLIMVFNVPLSSDHWMKIIFFMALSLGLFTFFIVFGVLMSSLARSSSISFLISLVVWVLAVMIIPRMGVMAAGNMVYVPRVAEIEGQLSGFAQSKWDEFMRGTEERWNKYNQSGDGVQLDEEKMWEIMQHEDSLHRAIEQEIMQHELKLREDLRQRKIRQEKLAFSLSRLSPVAAYQLGVMSLAGTGVDIKNRYEDAINNYRNEFYNFVQQKQDETGDNGKMMLAFTISDDGSQSMTMSGDRTTENLDISGMPQFMVPAVKFAEAISPATVDFGIIIFYIIMTFAGAFVAFLKYDVR